MPNTIELVIDVIADKAQSSLSGISKALGGLGDIAGGALKLGLAGVTAGFGALSAGIGIAINEAVDAEKIMAQTEAVIKSTGGIAGVTAEQVADLAGSLTKVTGVSDDVIQSGENMLLTFTNIGKDVFPDATKIALDMSVALGQDMTQSALQLGKALNDPVAGVSALQRVGVKFTDEQKDMIASLVESGDLMGAQKMILAELTTEFGGSAEAIGGTFSGQLNIFKESMLNLAETAGTQLLPVLTEGLKILTPIIADLVDQFVNWVQSDEFKQFLADLIVVIGQVAEWLGVNLPPVIQFLSDLWVNTLQPAIAIAWAYINDTLIPGIITLIDWLQVNVPAAITTLSDWWTTTWTTIQTTFDTFTAGLQAIWDFFAPAFEGDWYGFGENLRTAWDTLWLAITTAVTDAWPNILAAITTIGTDIQTFFTTTDWGAVGTAICAGIAAGITSGAQAIWDAATAAAQAALDIVKGFLGIQSPSKVFAGIGKNMMLGMAEGITKNADVPVTAAGKAAMNTAQNATTNNYNLTINSQARSEQVQASFALMQALAR